VGGAQAGCGSQHRAIMAKASLSATQVAGVYQEVMDDVIGGVKQHFSDEGLDESVLADLQQLWMQKLRMHSTVVGHRPSLGAGAAIKTEYRMAPTNGAAIKTENRLPQTDGAADDDDDLDGTAPAIVPDDRIPSLRADVGNTGGSSAVRATAHAGVAAPAAAVSGPAAGPIPQVDGGAEDSDDGELNSDDDELNSDDDDDEDDEETNFAVCQFEKIQRTRNRYKATLKNVIMQVDGTDYMFAKMVGEYTW